MKTLIAALVTVMFASTAQAGSYDAPMDAPIMAPVIVEEEAASSSAPSASLVLALLTLAVFGTAAAGN